MRFLGLDIKRAVGTGNPESPNTPLSEIFLQGSAGSSAGEVVTSRTAMSFSAVAACVRIISQTIASLPLQIIKEDENGNKTEDRSHRLFYLACKRPNNMMTRYKFYEAMVSSMLLRGNAYAIIRRDSGANIKRLDLIPDPSKVKILINENSQKLYYEIEGYKTKFQHTDILHLTWKTLDGITGISPIEYFKETIGNGLATSKFQGDFYKNGARLDGVISIPGSFESAEQQDRFRSSWRKTYSGQGKDRVAVLEMGADYKQLSISQHDAQFIETSKFNIEEIARIYGVPQHLLQSLDKATFNNIEEQGIDFVRHTIRPNLEAIEPELDYKLLSEAEKRKGDVYFNFDESALLRGDLKTQAESIKNLVFSGIMTPNEGRKKLNINKAEDENSDKLLVQSAMTRLEDLGTINNSNETQQ